MAYCERSPPPWEVLVLVSQHLDPQTLAIASCVCKSWSIPMSSDHLWQPLFTSRFPSLSNLANAAPISFRRLFSLGHAASTRRRHAPPKPLLSLADLVFSISVVSAGACIASWLTPGQELVPDRADRGDGGDRGGVFKFEVGVGVGVERECCVEVGVGEEVRVTWNVVLKGWKGVFTMIECGGRVGRGMGPTIGGWFSEELPAAGCCSDAVTGGIVADLKLKLRGNKDMVQIQSVSVGVLSVLTWRYLTLQNALTYLQHFLLP